MELSAHFFDTFAPDYEAWFGGLHRKVAERLVGLAAPSPGQVCLDAGCGTGLVANPVAALVGPAGHVFGLDVSSGMLGLAEAAAPANATYVRAGADHQFAFRDATFDLVTFCDSLAYMEDPFRSLDEARRVLRTGGRIGLALRRRSLDTVAQEVFFRMLDRLTEEHPVIIPQQRDSRGLLGEPQVVERVLLDAGFHRPSTSTLVTGGRTPTAGAWLDFMARVGPRPFALISTLPERQRRRLEQEVEHAMRRLGDEAYHHHQAFTLVVAVAR